MDTKEKHIRENESVERREHDRELHGDNMIADSMPAEGREKKRNDTRKTNKLWIWFGVMVLIAILLYWIFSIGIFGDMTASFNG